MTPEERRWLASHVLAKCAAFDNRKPNEATVLAWAEALDPMPLADAYRFVTDHYAASNDWIMPADLNRSWRQLSRKRLEAVPQHQRPLPPQDVTATEYLKFRKAVNTALQAGMSLQETSAYAHHEIGRTQPNPEISKHPMPDTRQIGKPQWQ